MKKSGFPFFFRVFSLFAFLSLLSFTTLSRDSGGQANDDKHFIGIQFNPFLTEANLDRLIGGELDRTLWVAAIRYGQKAGFMQNLRLGGEVNFYRFIGDYSNLNIGPFARYSLPVFRWASVFAEVSPMLSYYRGIYPISGLVVDGFEFAYYIAPGISLRNPENRVSFDAYWKFSGEPIIDGRNNVFSFKLNFHF